VAFLVIMFFCGLSAGFVGRIKGGSFPIWFLIGFALPILGTLAALLHRWEGQELRRRCEECGNVVAMHDQVCMRCGRDLEFPSDVLAPRPAR
jgi:hypothetical protein